MIGFSPQTQTAGPISRHGTYLTHVGCKRTAKDVTISGGDHQYFLSLSIRRFWGIEAKKGETLTLTLTPAPSKIPSPLALLGRPDTQASVN